MNDEWLVEANQIAATVARQVHRKYHVYFDQADVQQELVVWCLNHERKIREWLNPEQDPVDRKIGIKQLAKSMNREADKYCRDRKAKSCGYETRDEVFYTTGMLEELIANLEELELMTQQQTGNVRVSNGGSDPATSGGYAVSLIDVRAAMESLDPSDQIMLLMKYQEGKTLQNIADVFELSDSTISRHIHQALRKMSKYLGGDNPWGGTGSRMVISNHQAQSIVQDA